MVIATPVSTHYKLARQALDAGKSVSVEKPLAMSRREASDLVWLSRELRRVLMVGASHPRDVRDRHHRGTPESWPKCAL
jgi:predicted dehydrogenase